MCSLASALIVVLAAGLMCTKQTSCSAGHTSGASAPPCSAAVLPFCCLRLQHASSALQLAGGTHDPGWEVQAMSQIAGAFSTEWAMHPRRAPPKRQPPHCQQASTSCTRAPAPPCSCDEFQSSINSQSYGQKTSRSVGAGSSTSITFSEALSMQAMITVTVGSTGWHAPAARHCQRRQCLQAQR